MRGAKVFVARCICTNQAVGRQGPFHPALGFIEWMRSKNPESLKNDTVSTVSLLNSLDLERFSRDNYLGQQANMQHENQCRHPIVQTISPMNGCCLVAEPSPNFFGHLLTSLNSIGSHCVFSNIHISPSTFIAACRCHYPPSISVFIAF